MKFEGKNMKERYEGKKPFDVFSDQLRGWMTSPEDEDHCFRCWEAGEKNGKVNAKMKNASRPTVEVAGKREGTEGWYVVCRDCGKEVDIHK